MSVRCETGLPLRVSRSLFMAVPAFGGFLARFRESDHGAAWLGVAWRGRARLGLARQGRELKGGKLK